MSILDKADAKKIAKKLRAEIDTTPRAHDVAVVYEDGMEVASFGLRRGSRKSLGHDHLIRSLFVSPREARRLVDCSMSRDDWIARLRGKGLMDGGT